MIVGLKILVDLFDVLCILVVYISYNMGNRDLPDVYAHNTSNKSTKIFKPTITTTLHSLGYKYICAMIYSREKI